MCQSMRLNTMFKEAACLEPLSEVVPPDGGLGLKDGQRDRALRHRSTFGLLGDDETTREA